MRRGAEQEVVHFACLGSGGEFGPHLLEVGVHLRLIRGYGVGVEAHQAGADAVFADVTVHLRVGEAESGAAGDLHIGVDLGAVHPQQQVGFVDAVPLPVSGSVAESMLWIFRTRAPARSAASVVPYVVVPTKFAVRMRRPQASRRKSEFCMTPRTARGCSAWR